MIYVERYHDISAGHRIADHDGPCAHLHGHNYRITFGCSASNDKLDKLGRVVDFSIIKSTLCRWLEDFWDHRMLIHFSDPWYGMLREIDPYVMGVPFSPTAENMAEYLLKEIGPHALKGTNVTLVEVRVEETRKCSATSTLDTIEISD